MLRKRSRRRPVAVDRTRGTTSRSSSRRTPPAFSSRRVDAIPNCGTNFAGLADRGSTEGTGARLQARLTGIAAGCVTPG